MKKRPQERLEEAIELGKWGFILRHGVLTWGLSTATLYVFNAYWFGGHLGGRSVVTAYVIFPLMGLGWGGVMWWLLNRRWTQHLRNLVKKHRIQK